MLPAFSFKSWPLEINAIVAIVLFTGVAMTASLLFAEDLPEPGHGIALTVLVPGLLIALAVAARLDRDFGASESSRGEIEKLLHQKQAGALKLEMPISAKQYPIFIEKEAVAGTDLPIPLELAHHVHRAPVLGSNAIDAEMDDVLDQLITWKRRKR